MTSAAELNPDIQHAAPPYVSLPLKST